MAKTKKATAKAKRPTSMRPSIQKQIENDPFVKGMIILFSVLSIVYLWIAYWRYG